MPIIKLIGCVHTTLTTGCNDSDIRLVDEGFSKYAIKVEVCIGNFWRGLCFPGFFEDHNEVIVVACHQLGFPTEGNAKAVAVVD